MIKENGGTIVEAQTPHYVVATDLGGREGDICKCHAVSPRWIDACIVEGKLAPLGVNLDHFPKYHVSSKTCPDFADFTIVLGGFKPKQRNAIEKLVNTIGKIRYARRKFMCSLRRHLRENNHSNRESYFDLSVSRKGIEIVKV